MGCTSSKVEELPAVVLCKERCGTSFNSSSTLGKQTKLLERDSNQQPPPLFFFLLRTSNDQKALGGTTRKIQQPQERRIQLQRKKRTKTRTGAYRNLRRVGGGPTTLMSSSMSVNTWRGVVGGGGGSGVHLQRRRRELVVVVVVVVVLLLLLVLGVGVGDDDTWTHLRFHFLTGPLKTAVVGDGL